MHESKGQYMTQGERIVAEYTRLLSIQLGGPVWGHIEAGRIVIRGEGTNHA